MKEAQSKSICVALRRELNFSTDYEQLIDELLELEQTQLIVMLATPQVTSANRELFEIFVSIGNPGIYLSGI